MEIHGAQGQCSVGRQGDRTRARVALGNAKLTSTTLPSGSHSPGQDNPGPSSWLFCSLLLLSTTQAFIHKELREVFPVGVSGDVTSSANLAGAPALQTGMLDP